MASAGYGGASGALSLPGKALITLPNPKSLRPGSSFRRTQVWRGISFRACSTIEQHRPGEIDLPEKASIGVFPRGALRETPAKILRQLLCFSATSPFHSVKANQ